ncbi:MAG: hypothetical protein IJ429_00340 [Lachnospiraceae bacterium]|nr:hypothetical protein [Lachnospiraceae bacterium]
MGYDETEIIHYLLFGKKEELSQLPPCHPSVVLEDATGKTEFRPVYLFWDSADEKTMQLYCDCKSEEAKGFRGMLRSMLASVAVRHMQNKYKEVFLCHPETLFLSEKAEKEIPKLFWKMIPEECGKLHMRYGQREALNLLRTGKERVTLFCVIPDGFAKEDLLAWLFKAEKAAGVRLSDLFLLGDICQKESAEDVLEDFYEETGMAGSFYPAEECKKLIMSVGGYSLLLDCFGLPVKQVGRPTFYIDGAGVRTTKEIHRMEGVCKACSSLRMYLDRAFLSAL